VGTKNPLAPFREWTKNLSKYLGRPNNQIFFFEKGKGGKGIKGEKNNLLMESPNEKTKETGREKMS